MSMNDDDQPPSLDYFASHSIYQNHHETERRQAIESSKAYLNGAYCEDRRVKEHLAIPGYN